MLSEAIHSVVDCGNQILMLLGMRRAARPASETHPFGHGLQLYFWTFVVAVLVFGVGAGVSILEGVSKIRDPPPDREPLGQLRRHRARPGVRGRDLDRRRARVRQGERTARLDQGRPLQQGSDGLHGAVRGHRGAGRAADGPCPASGSARRSTCRSSTASPPCSSASSWRGRRRSSPGNASPF